MRLPRPLLHMCVFFIPAGCHLLCCRCNDSFEVLTRVVQGYCSSEGLTSHTCIYFVSGDQPTRGGQS